MGIYGQIVDVQELHNLAKVIVRSKQCIVALLIASIVAPVFVYYRPAANFICLSVANTVLQTAENHEQLFRKWTTISTSKATRPNVVLTTCNINYKLWKFMSKKVFKN